jgi:hypothetical protein
MLITSVLQIATRVGRKEGVEFTCDMAHFVLNRCHTPTCFSVPGV